MFMENRKKFWTPNSFPGRAVSVPVMHWFHLFAFHYAYRLQTTEWKQSNQEGKLKIKKITFFQENFSFPAW